MLLILVVAACGLIAQVSGASTFDVTTLSKSKIVFTDLSCNKDTVIDFSLSSSTQVNNCQTGTCQLSNPSSSSINFLDINGILEKMPLTSITITNNFVYRTVTMNAYSLIFTSGARKLQVIVPFGSTLNNKLDWVLDLPQISEQQLTKFSAFIDSALTASFDASSFNFLNVRDLGIFYHATSSDFLYTVLISVRAFKVTGSNPSLPAIDMIPIALSYSTSGDKLCYGSATEVIYQTHLRQSFPLWVDCLGCLIFWFFVLFSDETNLNRHDKSFRDNKWTSWPLYSLCYLADEHVFTRLSRSTIVYTTFCWQATILAGIYGTIGGNYRAIIILWSAIIAWTASYPFKYLLGRFLGNIVRTTRSQLELRIALREQKDVSQKANMQNELLDREDDLYAKWYGFYLLQFLFMVIFWVVPVHLMQQTAWNQYYLHSWWIYSLILVIVFDNFVFDPLMTWMFGNSKWLKATGFYFDYKVTELYKELEQ